MRANGEFMHFATNAIRLQPNSKGIEFTVVLVKKGERYGREFCLVHDKDEPLIEFYDSRYPHCLYGQFVTRYNLGTLAACRDGHGIDLCGGVDDWKLSQAQLSVALEWAEAAFSEQNSSLTNSRSRISQLEGVLETCLTQMEQANKLFESDQEWNDAVSLASETLHPPEEAFPAPPNPAA